MNYKVLLTDDDNDFREAIKIILQRANYEVTEASSGIEALEILQIADIDLLITDILMPEMEGIELADKARSVKPALKIIGMTGGGDTISVDKTTDLSKYFVDIFIQKPFPRNQLLDSVAKLLKV